MYINKWLATAAIVLIAITTSSAQKKIEWGIRAGGNISAIVGPSEKDANGQALESFTPGFRIFAGAYMRARLGERFGVQAEFNYIQKGGNYTYDGPGFDSLSPNMTGRRRLTLNTTLNYIEIPVLFYVEVIKKKISIEVGPSFGLLAGANAVGNTKYFDSNVTGDYGIEYDYNCQYFKDQAGGVYSSTTRTATVNNNVYYIPQIIGGYYQYTADQKAAKGYYYNIFDLGFNGGFTYRASGSLRLGARFQYSLLDITNNAYDYSLQTRHTPRSDIDRNLGFQFFLGFGF